MECLYNTSGVLHILLSHCRSPGDPRDCGEVATECRASEDEWQRRLGVFWLIASKMTLPVSLSTSAGRRGRIFISFLFFPAPSLCSAMARPFFFLLFSGSIRLSFRAAFSPSSRSAELPRHRFPGLLEWGMGEREEGRQGKEGRANR